MTDDIIKKFLANGGKIIKLNPVLPQDKTNPVGSTQISSGVSQIIDMEDAKNFYIEDDVKKNKNVDIKVKRSNDKVTIVLTGNQKDVSKFHNVINTVKFNKKVSGMNLTFKYVYSDTGEEVEQGNKDAFKEAAQNMKNDLVASLDFSDEILRKLGFANDK